MYSTYQQVQKEFGFTVVEGSQPIEQVRAVLRRAIMQLLLQCDKTIMRMKKIPRYSRGVAATFMALGVG